MNNIVQTFDLNINSILEEYVRKPTIIKAIVQLLLMLYAVRLAPTPPPVVLALFTNTYFKLFIFSLILWTAQVSPSTAILIAVAFMITINYTTTGKIWEMMDNTSAVTSAVTLAVTPDQSVNAVNVLAEVASSSSMMPPAMADSIVNIALANTTTQAGASAVKNLAQQALSSNAGSPIQVANSVMSSVGSIPSTSASSSTPAQSIQAVQALAQAASSPIPSPISTVIPVASIAMANITSSSGASAVQSLATQSAMAEAGTPSKVESATKTAIMSITSPDPISSTVPVVTSSTAMSAIQSLATSASSASSVSASIVVPVANIAASVMTSANGISAIQALAQQAMTPEAGTQANVEVAVKTAMGSMNTSDSSASTDSGCYPIRNYDMTKIMPMKDGQFTFEDYQQFMPTKQ